MVNSFITRGEKIEATFFLHFKELMFFCSMCARERENNNFVWMPPPVILMQQTFKCDASSLKCDSRCSKTKGLFGRILQCKSFSFSTEWDTACESDFFLSLLLCAAFYVGATVSVLTQGFSAGWHRRVCIRAHRRTHTHAPKQHVNVLNSTGNFLIWL